MQANKHPCVIVSEQGEGEQLFAATRAACQSFSNPQLLCPAESACCSTPPSCTCVWKDGQMKIHDRRRLFLAAAFEEGELECCSLSINVRIYRMH